MTTLAIVGARFRPPAKEILDNLSSGTKLLLRRQPDNPYDSNAVQVLLPAKSRHDGETEYGETIETLLAVAEHPENEPLHLGFIPRADAMEMAGWMDVQAVDGNPERNPMPVEWPATLTFLPSGQPAVSFQEPMTVEDTFDPLDKWPHTK